MRTWWRTRSASGADGSLQQPLDNSAESARVDDSAPVPSASRVGFEPTTKGLKVPCSTAELPAHRRRYHAQNSPSGDSVSHVGSDGTPIVQPRPPDEDGLHAH